MITRQLGGVYPLSLGTALIFESPEFDIKLWPNLLYVNLRTLYRNYVASIPREHYHGIDSNQFTQTFLDEVFSFESIVKELSTNRVKVFFYYPKYDKFDKVLPKSEKLVYNPEMFDDIEINMWEYVKREKLMVPFFYTEIGHELPSANEPTLLLSSFVIDLLSASNFPILMLLESYTGKIKKRQEWYTKIKFGQVKTMEDVSYPFNKFTLQVFGDKSGFIKGADPAIRRVVRQMAKEGHWSPVTGIEKIKYSISKLNDFKTKELLYSYL